MNRVENEEAGEPCPRDAFSQRADLHPDPPLAHRLAVSTCLQPRSECEVEFGVRGFRHARFDPN